MTEALYLVSKNVPFDVAFSLDALTRHAWLLRMRLFEGGRMDWEAGRFDPEGKPDGE
jgi:hypothetical protein